jgi:hypothetical protein
MSDAGTPRRGGLQAIYGRDLEAPENKVGRGAQ